MAPSNPNNQGPIEFKPAMTPPLKPKPTVAETALKAGLHPMSKTVQGLLDVNRKKQ